MALLVIVCGALLMIGGAVSLLMGFDIVMTERGSAMTLGGTIALSGGLVAVGIGFALLRLSQILAVLERRGEKLPGRTSVPDRPVVPLGGMENSSPMEVRASKEVPAMMEVPPGKAQSGGGVIPAVVAAGAVAAGTAGGLAWARTGHPVISSTDTDLPVRRADWAQTSDDTAAMASTIPAPLAVDDAASAVSAGIPDLEAELSRALAEPFAQPVMDSSALLPLDVPPAVVPTAEPEPKASFADGLSELLGKTRGRKRKTFAIDTPAIDTPAVDVPAVEISEIDHPPEEAPLLETTKAFEPAALSSPADIEIAEPDGALSVIKQGEVGLEEAAVSDVAPLPVPAMSNSMVGVPPDDADLRTIAPLGLGDPQASIQTRAKVLGTYNAGGRTYSMYADGSVEAVTEAGVERFASMEALRHHLSERNRSY